MDESNSILMLYLGMGTFMIVFNILPWVLTLISSKARGNLKLVWFLFAFFLSWLGYLVFYFVAVKPNFIEQQALKKQRLRARNENGMPL